MVNALVCSVFLRIGLPCILAASCAFRPCGLSAFYLLLLLWLPHVPSPTPSSVAGHTGRYLKVCLVCGFFNVVSQLVFQIVLLSYAPYAHFIIDCDFLESILRYIGYIRLDSIWWEDGIRWLLPDLLFLFYTAATWVLCSKLKEQSDDTSLGGDCAPGAVEAGKDGKDSSMLTTACKYMALASLGFTGVLRPCIPNAVYFLCFVGAATWWSCYKELGKAFGWVQRLCMSLAFLQIIALFLYQLQISQIYLPPDDRYARLFGLTDLIHTNCTDPREIIFSNAEWASFLNPFAVLWIYFLLAISSKLLINPTLLSARTRRPSYQAVGAGGDTGGLLQDSSGSIWNKRESVISEDSIRLDVLDSHSQVPEDIEEDSDLEEDPKIHLVLEAIISIVQLINRSSYIATNIIMMAWSITYHSWLTFILLLWACILWMLPNQRRAMLRSSPGLVLYALFLLLSQYIYGMDLTVDELPRTIEGVNLSQIGFVKYEELPCIPLLVKSLYTVMFWITLRQFIQERTEEKSQCVLGGVANEPFNITVTTTISGTPVTEISPAEEKLGVEAGASQSQLMSKVGVWVKGVLTKFWIWVVAIMLFVIGLGPGTEVVLYRIVYMALFLIFVLTFQLSYSAWRQMMYAFWVTVILYSMVVLVLVYTYQFDNFPEYWSNYTGIPIPLQNDIGLEVYSTGALFSSLLTPTFFVVITVIQLHYFHTDFLSISDITVMPDDHKNKEKEEEAAESENKKDNLETTGKEAETEKEKPIRPNLMDEFTLENFKTVVVEKGTELFQKGRFLFVELQEFVWRFLEVHMVKIVLFSTFVLAVYDVCAMHFIFAMLVCVAVPCSNTVQVAVSQFCSVLASILLLSKMIYQIDYIDPKEWDNNCTDSYNGTDPRNPFINKSNNNAEWIGFQKTDDLADLLKGYIGLILVMTIRAVVVIRQQYTRQVNKTLEPPHGVIFPDICREDADDGVIECAKFMLNYGFYKYGVEICLFTTVAVIGTRLDFYAVLYSMWLTGMYMLNRKQLLKMWMFYIVFIAFLLPMQYLICVGIPPGFCIDYPWNLEPELSYWLYLPDLKVDPGSYKLVTDFILLLFVCLQYSVFLIEELPNCEFYSGGNNKDLTIENIQIKDNPVPDFVTYTRTWLDIGKRIVLQSFFWVTLSIVFLTGTNRVNIFAIGYLLGSFLFLWKGEEFYLMPKKTVLKWWNWLLTYNVVVIFFKALLQLVGCVYLPVLQYNFCWLVQLFGVACLKKFVGGVTSKEIASSIEYCVVPHDEAGMMWDGICFGFLLIQRRFFCSHYFFHVIEEVKAQILLASRGAELIAELMSRQISDEQEEERKVLEKIKQKMEHIKATHQKTQQALQPTNHFEAIRSGDYYMFEEYDDEELDLLDDVDEEEEDAREGGVTISELLSNAMKTDLKQAAEKAKHARKQDGLDSGGDSPYEEGTDKPRQLVRRVSSRRRSTKSLQRSVSVKKQKSEVPAISADKDGDEREDDTIKEDGEPPDEPPIDVQNIMQRIFHLIIFSWEFIKSVLVSATLWLNRFSRDYRYVFHTLTEEKRRMKEGTYDDAVNPYPVATSSKHQSKESLRDTEKTQSKVEVVEIHIEKASEDGDLDSVRLDTSSPQESIRPGSRLEVSGSHTGLLSVASIGSRGLRMSTPHDTVITTLDSLEVASSTEMSRDPYFDYDRHVILQFVSAIWYVVLSHSELVCYFMVFLDQLKSASAFSIPLPLMVFLWGSLSVPRPSKNFWVALITYTELLVTVKWFFQFDFFYWNQVVNLAPFFPPRILGVEKKEKFAIYDLLLLMVVFFHRNMLKSMGLWRNSNGDNKEEEILVMSISSARGSVVGGGAGGSEPPHSLLSSDVTSSPENAGCVPSYQHMQSKIKSKINQAPDVQDVMKEGAENVKTFMKELMDPSDRVSADVYAYMFMCDFFNFLVVIFGFAAFGTQTGDGGVSAYLEENKVPIPFLVMLILQFGLIVIDRALYLRKFILGKFIFQIILIVGVHMWMFFILPAVTERQFNAALPPQIWYMAKCFYLLLSAYQIRSGYPTRILGNYFCKKYNYLYMFLFKGFMAVPFLFELRALMDWIWTETSMTLGDWLKLEDIFANIFQLKCQRRVEKEYPQPRGEPKRPLVKYGVGGCFLFVIIAIIWFPLVLFALGSTVGEPNLPSEVTINIIIEGYQPLFSTTAQKDSLQQFSESQWTKVNDYYTRNRAAMTFLSNYDARDVVAAQLNGNSTSIWGISPPAQTQLINDLLSSKSLVMKLSWQISRTAHSPTQPKDLKDEYRMPLEPNTTLRKGLAAMVAGDPTAEAVKIPSLMPRFLKITNTGKAIPVSQLDTLSGGTPKKGTGFVNASLLLTRRAGTFDNESSPEEWWLVEEDCNPGLSWLPFYGICNFLNIYTFNEKSFPSTLSFLSGGGIIGLYTTLVLVASKMVRGFFAGVSYTIMFDDMPNVDRILQLCLDIYLVRESGELALEEDLFAKLIFLYRSPETLIKWTRPKNEEENDHDT